MSPFFIVGDGILVYKWWS